MSEPEDAAAEAFEALRAEVGLLRADLAGLKSAATAQATDYAPTLGAMAKSLAAIEEHPALKLTPASFAAQLTRAAEVAGQQGGRDLVYAVQQFGTAAAEVRGLVQGHRTAREQHKWLAAVGAAGFLAGVVAWVCLTPPIARALPASWHVPERMAAVSLGLDLWDAGQRLMQAADPVSWGRIVEASDLVKENGRALEDCRRAATGTGKAQRCIVILNQGAPKDGNAPKR